MKTKLPIDSLGFEWNTTGGKRREGDGSDYSNWKGTATQDLGFLVTAIIPHSGHERRVMYMSDSVLVRPRPWSLPEQSATLQWVDSIPLPEPEVSRLAWGYYGGADPDSLLEGTVEGTGPWEGSHMLAEGPTITAAKMYAHNDLKSGGPEYVLNPDVDTADVEECGVSGDFVAVYALNDSCGGGHRDSLTAFKDWVVAHEREHENSLNRCIRAVNDGRLAAVEKIVGKTETAVADSAKDLWTDDLREKLLDAKETDQTGTGTDFYHWRRFGAWVHGGRLGDHSGTDGC